MITLDTLEKAIGLFILLGGGVLSLVRWLEKRAKEKEAARLWAKSIDEKLMHLESNNGRLTEELEDVRRDFAQFVQQMLFKNYQSKP